MSKAIPLRRLCLFGREGGGRGESCIDTFFFHFAERIFTPTPSHSAPFVVAWIWQCFDVLNSSC